jgi:hypothetical protein
MSTGIAGGWTNFVNPLTADAKHVFEEAVTLLGVSYQPFAFATQVVAGTNYCFLCTTTVVTPEKTQGAAKVYVLQPLPGQGKPHITEIVQVVP